LYRKSAIQSAPWFGTEYLDFRAVPHAGSDGNRHSLHDKRVALHAAIKAMAPDVEVRTLGRRRLRDRS
jgi:hypothetical protein